MIQLVARATTTEQLKDELELLLRGASSYLDEGSREFAEASVKLDKLGKTDAVGRSLLYGWLFTLCGNRERVEYYIENARRLNADQLNLKLVRLTAYLNLGYISEARTVLEELVSVDCGRAFSVLLNRPPSSGSFHAIWQIAQLAEKMRLTNVPPDTENFASAVRVMDFWGDTDSDYSNVLDIAGQILRERKLFYRGSMLTSIVEKPDDGGAPYIRLAVTVGVDLETSIDMTCDFSDRLARSGQKIPQSLIFEFESEEV